jgi:sortase A
MRLHFPAAPALLVVRATRYALLVTGLSLLAWCAFLVIDSWQFQQVENARLDEQLAAPTSQNNAAPPRRIANLVGRIEIARLGLSAIIVEGTTAADLHHAVGHIPGTALPGQPGNIGLSGHRDTFFFPLRNIRQDDEIQLTTTRGKFRYRVTSTTIVKPADTGILEDTDSEILTLVTCYPFQFIGSAPERYIVRAERQS